MRSWRRVLGGIGAVNNKCLPWCRFCGGEHFSSACGVRSQARQGRASQAWEQESPQTWAEATALLAVLVVVSLGIALGITAFITS